MPLTLGQYETEFAVGRVRENIALRFIVFVHTIISTAGGLKIYFIGELIVATTFENSLTSGINEYKKSAAHSISRGISHGETIAGFRLKLDRIFISMACLIKPDGLDDIACIHIFKIERKPIDITACPCFQQ